MPSKTQQAGATLIESLVSLVILAIAVIGMLGVQVRTLVETNISANRSQAMLLAEDLSERIKANPKRYGVLSSYAGLEVTDAPSSTVDCGSTSCTPDQLVQYDREEWGRSITNTLPGGRAKTFISGDDAASDPRQLGVLIGWVSKEKNSNDSYLEHFAITSADASGEVSCWTGYICHLIFIQP